MPDRLPQGMSLDELIAMLMGPGSQGQGDRLGGKGDRVVGAQGPLTPPGVRMNPMYTPNDQETLDEARAGSANAPQATPFNPLQNAVDYAPTGGTPFNPLQNAVDTAPTQPPVPTPKPYDPMAIQSVVDAAGGGAPVPTPRPAGGGGGVPTPTPRPAGGGGGGGGVSPAAAPSPERAALAAVMAAQPQMMSGRGESAGYTTSGPGWPGKSSAIFGRNARR